MTGCERPAGGLLPASPFWSAAILLLLAVPALLSLLYAVRGALASGLDFQWSGAHLLVLRQDPWMIYLHGDPGHQIVLGQNPNYLAELYLLLYPLGMMSLSHAMACWCAVNLALLACVLFMTCRLFQLDRHHSILLLLLTLCSTPFRATMLNGQASFFILLMLTALYYAKSRLLRAGVLGLSYAKYSFSPLVVMVQLFKGRLVTLLLSALPPLAGLLIVKLMLREGFMTLALEPLRTSRLAMAPGWGDMMTTLEKLMAAAGASPGITYLLPVMAGLGASLVAAFFIARVRNLESAGELALVLVFTLLCLQHLIYDYVALMAPIAALLVRPASALRTVALCTAAYIWFGASILNHLQASRGMLVCLCNFAVILVFALSFMRLTVLAASPAEGNQSARALDREVKNA